MRKLLYTLAGLSALALFASCNKEAQLTGGEDGATVKASFTVQLPDAVQTKAISDGSGATQLLFKVYDQSNKHLPNLDQTITVSDRKATVTVNLVKGVKYQYVFWAQTPNQYTLDADNATLTITPADMMNSDAWDAFYWHEPLAEVTAAFSKTITLRRPFAQINFGSLKADYQAAEASQVAFDATLKTWISMEQVPTVLNLLDGTVGTPKDLAFQSNAWIGNSDSTQFLTVTGFTEVRYVEMAYVLAAPAPQGQLGKVILNIGGKQNGNDFTATRTVTNVPYCRNYRTHVVGHVFTDEGTFHVIVEPAYDDNLNKDL